MTPDRAIPFEANWPSLTMECIETADKVLRSQL